MELPKLMATQQPTKPDPNTYWVVPGKLLASEYPGAQRSAMSLINASETLPASQAIKASGDSMLVSYKNRIGKCG